MKAQLIYGASVETALISTLLHQCVTGEGEPLEIIETQATKQTAMSSIDESCPILIFAGIPFRADEDQIIKSYLEREGNVPFVDFFVIGSIVKLPPIAGVHIVRPYDESTTVIEQTYKAFQEHKGLFHLEATPVLDRNVNLLHQYYRYTFNNNADYYYAGAMVHLYDAVGNTMYKLLGTNTVDGLLGVEAYRDIIENGYVRQTNYVNHQLKSVVWRMLPDLDGSYISLAVVHGSRYKNEIAHALLNSIATTKGIVVVIEERFNTIMTIRTKNFNALTVGQLVYDKADGLSSAVTVFADLTFSTQNVAQAFEKALNTLIQS